MDSNSCLAATGATTAAPMPNMMQPGIDPSKVYIAEAENLDLMNPICILDGIEERILQA